MFVKSYGNKQMNAMFDSMAPPPVTISAAPVRHGSWPREVEAVGTFAAVNGAELATEAGGVVETIAFQNGETIKAGQVLVRLDTDVDVAQLKALKAAARLAETGLKRVRRLYQLNSISKAELDARESRARQARANVVAQHERIAQKIIKAPFDGVLGIRAVNRGQYVNAGTAIVSLQQLDPIFLNFMLPEQHLADVSDGLPVLARVDAFPGRTFRGTVTAIEPQVNPTTRNFMVQASVDNAGHRLHPGMFANVELHYGKALEVLTVPQTAISFNPYGNSVYVIRENQNAQTVKDAPVPTQIAEDDSALTATQRFVRTGARRGDLIAIVEGLKPGERVATSGLLKLSNDAVVLIDNSVQPEADVTPLPPNS
jgi:membrane fusion protein (multidrug efflux system)